MGYPYEEWFIIIAQRCKASLGQLGAEGGDTADGKGCSNR